MRAVPGQLLVFACGQLYTDAASFLRTEDPVRKTSMSVAGLGGGPQGGLWGMHTLSNY
eukprot:COSAG02_NODE_17284_length_1015_cov_1.317686_1_plen_57_part_10